MKKLAILPITCPHCNKVIWFEYYYSIYLIWETHRLEPWRHSTLKKWNICKNCYKKYLYGEK